MKHAYDVSGSRRTPGEIKPRGVIARLLLMSAGLLAAVAVAAQPALPPERTVEGWTTFLSGSESWDAALREGRLALEDPDLLPGDAWFPDALTFRDGTPVATSDRWAARRRELLQLFEHYVTGTLPPPRAATARVVDESTTGGVVDRHLRLEFPAAEGAAADFELIIPPGEGPFPVYLTQANHRAWALVAVSRGYLACVYDGADIADDTPSLAPLWPDSDAALLIRRAWLASRCIDYLEKLPEADTARIAVIGHSRNATQAMIAAAFDERITAAVLSGGGAGFMPYRINNEVQMGEGIELQTRKFPTWFHPRMRFFSGRENRLPIDLPELMACIAPRNCLISTALNDFVQNVWSVEHSWREARRVYDFLGVPQGIELSYHWGTHETDAMDVETQIDWLDGKFGRAPAPVMNQPIYPTYADWLRISGERVDPAKFPVVAPGSLLATASGRPITTLNQWEQKTAGIQAKLRWQLGEPIPMGPGRVMRYGTMRKYRQVMYWRHRVPEDVRKISFNFGQYLTGDFYLPADWDPGQGTLPALIWMHPSSVPSGNLPAYGGFQRTMHFDWVRAGYAVFAFDQIGNGDRLEEVIRFYNRHPHSSILGRTVQDVSGAIDALLEQPMIDPQRIYALGYAMGAWRRCTRRHSIIASPAWWPSRASRQCAPTLSTGAPGESNLTASGCRRCRASAPSSARRTAFPATTTRSWRSSRRARVRPCLPGARDSFQVHRYRADRHHDRRRRRLHRRGAGRFRQRGDRGRGAAPRIAPRYSVGGRAGVPGQPGLDRDAAAHPWQPADRPYPRAPGGHATPEELSGDQGAAACRRGAPL